MYCSNYRFFFKGCYNHTYLSNILVLTLKIIVLRKLCVSRNTARLSSFPSHPSLACPSCTKKMRLWPEQVVESTAIFWIMLWRQDFLTQFLQGPLFTCDSGEVNCPSKGKKELASSGENRCLSFVQQTNDIAFSAVPAIAITITTVRDNFGR